MRPKKTTYPNASAESTPTSFYYDGAVPMSDFTMALFGSGGGQIHRQVFGANDQPLYLLVSGVRGYAYQDGLGSVVALANGTASPAGALAGSYGYDAYGIAASATGPVLRYAAARYDALPGLLYMNARFYHPALGRFLQPDPIGYAGGNNLYAYAANDPVNLTDPSGLYAMQAGNAVYGLLPNRNTITGAGDIVLGGVLVGLGGVEGFGAAVTSETGVGAIALGTGAILTVGAGVQSIQNGLVLMNQNQQTADQQALKDVVNQATNEGRKPLSVEDANTVLDWAEEYNYPGVRAGSGDVSQPSNWTGGGGQPHIHLPGAGRGGHVPVEPGLLPR